MAYLDSTHFSDKFSYKILCIPSYGLKDMILTRFTYLQEFLKNREFAESFLTELQTSPSR
jgi:hypothetical protein